MPADVAQGHASFAGTCGSLLTRPKIRGSPHKPRGPALQNKKHLIALRRASEPRARANGYATAESIFSGLIPSSWNAAFTLATSNFPSRARRESAAAAIDSALPDHFSAGRVGSAQVGFEWLSSPAIRSKAGPSVGSGDTVSRPAKPRKSSRPPRIKSESNNGTT